MSFEEFNNVEVFDVEDELVQEAEEILEEEITEGSPPEKIENWARDKASKAIEAGKEIVDWSEWLEGWKTPNASEKKQLFMYHYIREYLEKAEGLDTPTADSLARGLVGLTFNRADWMASLFGPEVLREIRTNPTVADIYRDVYQQIRRASDYYISLTPEELSRVAEIVALGKSENLPPREVASAIVNEITRLSPRSIYFNLYYIGRTTGDRFVLDVAREVGRIRRR